MKKIEQSLLLFTRTLQIDYRWIYWNEIIKSCDKSVFEKDIQEFENNRQLFLQNNHLFVRKLDSGIAIYKFFDTQTTDSSMRKIYALSGVLFSSEYLTALCDILNSVIADAFLNLDCNYEGVFDSTNKQNKTCDYPIESLFKKLFLDPESTLLNIKQEIEKFVMYNENKYGFFILERDGKIELTEFKSSLSSEEALDSQSEEDPPKFFKKRRRFCFWGD